MWCTQCLGHHLLCPYLTKREPKSNTVTTTASLASLLLHSRQKGSSERQHSGHKHQAPPSSGRPVKAKNSFSLPWQEGSSQNLWTACSKGRSWDRLGENTPINQSTDGMVPAGCGRRLHWQTLTTLQGVPGGQQSTPCIPPSLVSLFFTCTSLTSISCSHSVLASLMPAFISSLSLLPFHLLVTSTHMFQIKTALQGYHRAAARAFLSACHSSCEDPTPSQVWTTSSCSSQTTLKNKRNKREGGKQYSFMGISCQYGCGVFFTAGWCFLLLQRLKTQKIESQP